MPASGADPSEGKDPRIKFYYRGLLAPQRFVLEGGGALLLTGALSLPSIERETAGSEKFARGGSQLGCVRAGAPR